MFVITHVQHEAIIQLIQYPQTLTNSPLIQIIAESILLSLSDTLESLEAVECPFTNDLSLCRIYSIARCLLLVS